MAGWGKPLLPTGLAPVEAGFENYNTAAHTSPVGRADGIPIDRYLPRPKPAAACCNLTRKPATLEDRFAEPPLAKRFRELYLQGLMKLLRKQQLAFPESLSWIQEEEDLERWLDPIAAKRWHVHCQGAPPDCEGPGAALKYLAR